MNGRQALARARRTLAEANPENTPLEAEVLLRHALGVSRVRLYQEFNREMAPGVAVDFWEMVERRRRGEPVAYITGHREFYGLDFSVDRRVLIPRPESELLVEKTIELAHHRSVSAIADIGTGSGTIAVCLALNLPGVKIYATDVSPDALEVARHNSRQHKVSDRITFLPGDLLEPLPEPVDIIVANLPYVAESEIIGPLSFEPLAALNGGPDGLVQIRRLCRQLPGRLCPEGCLVMEIGYSQRMAVVGLLKETFSGAGIDVVPDLAGIDRMVCLSLVPAGMGERRRW